MPFPSRLPPAVVLILGTLPSFPAHATQPPFEDQEPLGAAEMAEMRGGMVINGITMDFAIVIRSTVEGAVSQGLQTVLTVNGQGGLASAVTTPIGTGLTTNDGGGMTLTLPAGTTIVHEVLDGHMQSLIANTSSGVTLNQSTEINVDLPGFTAQTQIWYSGSRAAQAGMEAALRGLGSR